MNVLGQVMMVGLLAGMTGMAYAQADEAAAPAKARIVAKPGVPAKANLPAKPTVATKQAGAVKQNGVAPTGVPVKPSTPAVPAAIPLNRKVVVLDPAHGGVDSGSRISDSAVEKDVTLALAYRLRSLLTARGFTVVMTRDTEGPAAPNAAGAGLTLDDRAGVANHAHAAACLVLHATRSGTGVHVYRSELEGTEGQPSVVPWLTAQAAWVRQSELLERQVAKAFSRSGMALVASNASVRPIDSLACPALVVELAPRDEDVDSLNDTEYQQQVALALAGAMLFWQNEVQAPIRLVGTSGVAGLNDATKAQP